MARRNNWRKTARSAKRTRGNHSANSTFGRSRYRRQLRLEPLEDRRLLALVTVTTLEDSVDLDDGLTSLREAIFAANTVEGADTIEFAPELAAGGPATILLTQGELPITDTLAIEGPGADLLTIDASGNDPTPNQNNGDGSRVFYVSNGGAASTVLEVEISGMTLTGGDVVASGEPDALEGTGGAVYSSETITMRGVRANDSHALRGGAIASVGGNLTLIDCEVSGNSSTRAGGGVYVSDSKLSIVDCVISGNVSSDSGGGIANRTRNRVTTLEILGSTIVGNSAYMGGGLTSFHTNSTFLLRGTIVGNNSARSGGGISLSVHGGATTIDRSSFSGNIGSGASINVESGQFVMEESTASENKGGGLHLRNVSSFVAQVNNSTIANNTASQFGGGIFINGKWRIQGSTITGNHAQIGGGILARPLANTQVLSSTITDNTATLYGGGLHLTGGYLEMQHSIVAGNHAPNRIDLSTILGPPIAARYNLIGNYDETFLAEAPVSSPDANGNLIGGAVHGVIDPLLEPLADNGGPTMTHALLGGSPAINAGNLNLVAGQNGVPASDQRGEPFGRIVGGRIDFGAFEYQTPADLSLLVDTLTDESDGDYSRGDLSLREAIELANTSAQEGVVDTIRFDPALWAEVPATILLTQGEIYIADSLTIDGPGLGQLTIDASGSDPTPDLNNRDGRRLFNIDNFLSDSAIDVTMRGVTLTGGDAAGAGGAIWSGANLHLDGVLVVGNSASFGAGVYSEFGDLTISASRFLGNQGLTGAAIFARVGELHVANTEISYNLAGGSAGSIVEIDDVTAEFDQVEIDGNFTAQTPSSFSVVFARNADVSFIKSSVSGNDDGVGINGANIGLLRLEKTAVSANGNFGIRLQSSFDSEITITDSTISGNGNAGIDVRDSSGAVTIVRSTIANNRSRATARAAGLNLEFHSGSITMIDSVVSGNRAVAATVTNPNSIPNAGGARLLLGEGVVTIERSSFFGNTVPEIGFNAGGGLSIDGGTAMITDSRFYDNKASAAAGISLRNTDATILRTSVTGNTARYFAGGIGSITGSLTVIDSNISQNSAARGGGIGSYGAVLVRGSTISSNTVHLEQFHPGDGGGIFTAGKLTVVDTTIEGNTAAGPGGGARSLGGMEIVGSTIANNTAATGGGVWSASGLIRNSTISGNAAVVGAGVHASTAQIEHSTITRNRATGNGGGVFVDGSTLTLDHAIVALNTGPTPDVTGLIGSTIHAEHSLLGSNSGSGLAAAPVGSPDANGNLIGTTGSGRIDPMLGPLADNGGPTLTHALHSGSPAINAGDPAAVAGVGGVLAHDQRGEPFTRVYGGRIDMGAVEVIPAGFLPGDYFTDGIVDMLDYSMWRNTMGTNVTPGTGADGNGDGAVDSLDYAVWKRNFGAKSEEQGASFGFAEDVGSGEQRVEALAVAAGNETLMPTPEARRARVQVVFDDFRPRAVIGRRVAGQAGSGALAGVESGRMARLLAARAAVRNLETDREVAAGVLAGSESDGHGFEATDRALAELEVLRVGLR